ncbi:acyl-CoA dehydrogenase [Pokkaliibacter sp. CJK22405]|uniref:acyl-CoA dehydrogenase n=1 Tax=Pokkaliibacter sp. CJK22405 TaxID=3384615 RepID=UPI0039854995
MSGSSTIPPSPPYLAPMKDSRFVLEYLIGTQALASLPEQQELSPELIDAVLNEAAKLASDVWAPTSRLADKQGATLKDGVVQVPEACREALAQFTEGGWQGIRAPESFGGQGLPQVIATAVAEYWQSANLALALNPLLSQSTIEALLRHGSDELQNRYLPGLISGRYSGTMNLTEPQAGSDLALLNMRAEPAGEHYRLYGQKIYITWGEHECSDNILHMVLARLPEAPPGVKGISLFLVPKWLDDAKQERNDVQALALEHKLGIHGSPTCVMSYGDNGGALGYLIGEPHQGLPCMFTMMNHARQAVGVQGLGVAERAWQQARAYAAERRQGTDRQQQTVSIDHHPDVQRMLLMQQSALEAMRALALTAAFAEDQAKHDKAQRVRADLLTPIVKGWLTELAQECTGLAIQVHGGMGFIEETGIAQCYRDARILTIYEGTTGIQALDLLGRKCLADKGVGVSALLAEVDATLKPIELAELQADVSAVRRSLEQARAAATWLAQRAGAGEMQATQAAAVPWLMLLGYLCGGWLLLKSALAAIDHDDQRLHKTRMLRFYCQHWLSRTDGLLIAITEGGDSLGECAKALFEEG